MDHFALIISIYLHFYLNSCRKTVFIKEVYISGYSS